jgi:HAD superfamily hydrolase (TIGR01490 family)
MGSGGGRSGRAAFFDVDETLIALKSMFRFLRFHLAERGLPTAVYDRLSRDLADLAAAGVPREETNRAYYRIYADQKADRLAEQGGRWFAAEVAEPGFLVPETVAALAGHRAAGDLTVLVSGSFPACVDPLAEWLGADVAVCSQPAVRHGSLTGELVGSPVIGEGKAAAVRGVLADAGIPASACSAYGDHASDLPMLEAVGRPVVVGDDPRLRTAADRGGWTVLPIAVPAAGRTG